MSNQLSTKIISPVARRIWGSPDAMLLFFAGGAAEFAAIKAVDWLFYTNALPSAPVERFFDTVRFAQHVFFSDLAGAEATINNINRIHGHVEKSRGMAIPQWAYRDVLYITIDYAERAHQIVFGPMTDAERVEYFEAGIALGQAMHLEGLPATYAEYQVQRHQQFIEDYAHTPLTDKLFASYKAAIGPVRYWALRYIMAGLIPVELRNVLGLKPNWLVDKLLRLYRYLPGGGNKLRWVHGIILPPRFAKQLGSLARNSNELIKKTAQPV